MPSINLMRAVKCGGATPRSVPTGKQHRGNSLPHIVLWSLAGIISITLTVMAFVPATWITALIEHQFAGHFTFEDTQGTLWRGSAIVTGTRDGSDTITPLLPGRFSWSLSPMVLLGSVDAELENVTALSQPVSVTGDWHQWQVSPSSILLPAERLTTLGAPLNTVQPSGQMRLSWGALQLTQQDERFGIDGEMRLEMQDLASRLSPVKPLGSYELAFAWHGTQASVMLKTLKGPLLLNGSGMLNNGQLQFSGSAQAETKQQQGLVNFMNLLGQRRKVGNTELIALEFK